MQIYSFCKYIFIAVIVETLPLVSPAVFLSSHNKRATLLNIPVGLTFKEYFYYF